ATARTPAGSQGTATGVARRKSRPHRSLSRRRPGCKGHGCKEKQKTQQLPADGLDSSSQVLTDLPAGVLQQ
ncbi:unnamed protein product, partial [Polarella glacialis]